MKLTDNLVIILVGNNWYENKRVKKSKPTMVKTRNQDNIKTFLKPNWIERETYDFMELIWSSAIETYLNIWMKWISSNA
jgi:CRISPR/Cas system CSM-associated protein Csm5 (group 7 of RAMP superfamily)